MARNRLVPVTGVYHRYKNTLKEGIDPVPEAMRTPVGNVAEIWYVEDPLHKFKGEILECYNMLPWESGADSSFHTRASFSMQCSCINLYSFWGGQLWDADYFGYIAARHNSIGADIIYGGPLEGMPTSERDELIRQRGGGVGGIITPDTRFTGNWSGFITRPNMYVGNHFDFVDVDVKDEVSGEMNTWTFGFMSDGKIGRIIPINAREHFGLKDCVFWFYKLKYDWYHPEMYWPELGFTDPEKYFEYDIHVNLQHLQHSNDLFLPRQRGMRWISSEWKDAPWERYPHLT
jgi:hypothetical protein